MASHLQLPNLAASRLRGRASPLPWRESPECGNRARVLKNRRDAGMLAGMDDRMLADIGLTRSDLRDAYAQPLWRDPTDMLAGRARERRSNRANGLIDVPA